MKKTFMREMLEVILPALVLGLGVTFVSFLLLGKLLPGGAITAGSIWGLAWRSYYAPHARVWHALFLGGYFGFLGAAVINELVKLL